MPRIGRHPLKEHSLLLKDQKVEPITITTITHIPVLDGYWADSLAVLNLFFSSLYESTDQSFDLIVFDNASCREVTDYLTDLKEQGRIQYLLLSDRNFRKLGALDYLLRLAPGEFVAYADSDVYFLPGWLERSLEVMKAFPQAGMISAIPTVDKSDRFVRSTLEGIHQDPAIQVQTGPDLVPVSFIRAHYLSLGKNAEDFFSPQRQDVRISQSNVSAFVSAQDFQFLTSKAVINQVLPLTLTQADETYDPIYSPVFESRVDGLGYWRLSTTDYLVHHMGNRPPDLTTELADIFPGIQLPVHEEQKMHRKRSSRFFQMRFVRKLLKKIHTWSYRLLFENSK